MVLILYLLCRTTRDTSISWVQPQALAENDLRATDVPSEACLLVTKEKVLLTVNKSTATFLLFSPPSLFYLITLNDMLDSPWHFWLIF